MLIFISDPSFPFVFFFSFGKNQQADSTLFILFFLSLEKRQEHRCVLAGSAPQPGALAGGASSRGFRAEGGAATPALRSSGAPLPSRGPLLCGIWVFSSAAWGLSPPASFIKVRSGKVHPGQRDAGTEASGITRLFELPSLPVRDWVGMGAHR